jgi:hypothetical protein
VTSTNVTATRYPHSEDPGFALMKAVGIPETSVNFYEIT